MIGWSRWTLRHQNFLGKNLCLIPEKRADRQREKAIPEKMCGKNLRYGMLLYEEARKKRQMKRFEIGESRTAAIELLATATMLGL